MSIETEIAAKAAAGDVKAQAVIALFAQAKAAVENEALAKIATRQNGLSPDGKATYRFPGSTLEITKHSVTMRKKRSRMEWSGGPMPTELAEEVNKWLK